MFKTKTACRYTNSNFTPTSVINGTSGSYSNYKTTKLYKQNK